MDLKPMLCKDISSLKQGEIARIMENKWIKEPKVDGCRALIEITRNDIRIFNRHAQNITFKFPEFLDLMRTAINNSVNSVVLDGEIISQTDNFREILQRTSLLNPTEIRLRSSKYPLKFMVFDVLQVNDDRLLDIPLMTRKGILDGIVKDTERIIKMPYYEISEEIPISSIGNEGVVYKYKMSQYYSIRSDLWRKWKHYDYTTCEIKGFHLGERGQNIVLETEQGEVSVSSRDRIAQFHRDSPKFVVVRHLPVNVKDKMRQPIFIDFRNDELV